MSPPGPRNSDPSGRDVDALDAPAETQADLKPLISIREAAAILGIGPTAAYVWLARGELPGAVQLGGRHYVRRAVLATFLAGHDVLYPHPENKAARPSGQADGRS